MSLDEMKAIAAEAGLDPDLVERAAHLIPSTSRDSLLQRLTGGPFARDGELHLPVPLSRDRAEHLVAILRATAGTHGEGEVTSAGLSWASRETAELLHVSAYATDQGTKLRIVVDNRRRLVTPFIIGGMGAFLSVMVAMSVGSSAESFATWLPYVILFGGVSGAAAVVRTALQRIGRRTQTTLGRLLDAVRDAVEDPSAS
jgi:hypothetical protein